ncbi:MAG: hypothetical protein RSC99_08825 [Clostridiales bacterium]
MKLTEETTSDLTMKHGAEKTFPQKGLPSDVIRAFNKLQDELLLQKVSVFVDSDEAKIYGKYSELIADIKDNLSYAIKTR